MTARKSVYTKENTVRLVTAYKAATSAEDRAFVVEQFAQELGVKPASVIAKLVREEVYIKPERVSKRKATKAELVARIATQLNVEQEQIESLEKANAKVLNILAEALS